MRYTASSTTTIFTATNRSTKQRTPDSALLTRCGRHLSKLQASASRDCCNHTSTSAQPLTGSNQCLNMLDSTIDHVSTSTLPPEVPTSSAIRFLHDFDTLISLNSDHNSHKLIRQISDTESEYQVDEQLAFIPRKLWHGGVKYKSVFTRFEDGCDITVNAPFFKSVNRWRIENGDAGERTVRITSDAKCGKAFASAVKKFLGSSHEELQRGFGERVAAMQDGMPDGQ